jgi:hypothetical protein
MVLSPFGSGLCQPLERCTSGVTMARRRNYGFDRRQREATQRSRQEAKRARKAERATQGAAGPEMGAAEDAGAPAGQWEWFSPSRGRVMATEPNQRPVADGVDDWQLLTDAADAEGEAQP